VHSTASNGPHKSVCLHGVGVSGTVIEGGPVSGTWARTDSPYAVTGDIYVPMRQSLSIEPGVRVEFAGHFGLTVGYRATLEAVGTPDENIVFTAQDKTEGWFGIRFVNSADDDTLQYCAIQYARKRRTEGGGYLNLMGGGILCCGSDEAAPGYFVHSSPLIDHCLIARNEGEYGGGVMVADYSNPWIMNCTIVDNTTNSYGGGIFIYGAAGLIVNNVVAHNYGNVSGGITVWRSAPTISNNTIVRNRPNGLHLDETDIWLWNSVPIVNNIIWGNEMYMEEEVRSSGYLIRFNDIQGNWGGQGNLSVEPLFADPENRDYHLKSQAGRWDPKTQSWVIDEVTSPCVDTGDPASPTGAEPVPHGGRLNIGAYGGTPEASKSPK
jgi:autonomous glycyl radical cofactor GrcA